MITLKREVGRPLTADEADENIADLDARLRAFNERGLLARGIETLSFDEGSQAFVIKFTDGTTLGPYALPLSFFRPRGSHVLFGDYLIRDYVTVDGSSYVCLASHKAGNSFAADLAAGKWQLNSKAGQDGLNFDNYRGVWSPTQEYFYRHSVLYPVGSDYALYRATGNVPMGKAPGSSQAGVPWWTQHSFPGGLGTDEVHAYVAGKPTASQVVLRRRFARALQFGDGFVGALATLDTPATAAMTFAIATRQAGTAISNIVGTLSFAAGSSTGAFATGFNPTVAIGAGGLLTITAPSTPDANAAGLEIAIPYSLK